MKLKSFCTAKETISKVFIHSFTLLNCCNVHSLSFLVFHLTSWLLSESSSNTDLIRIFCCTKNFNDLPLSEQQKSDFCGLTFRELSMTWPCSAPIQTFFCLPNFFCLAD